MKRENDTRTATFYEASRRIIHIDMDAFYTSVEQRDDPSLRGRPIAVGRGAARGVVAAASYEARQFGVRSAMPSIVARRKCPQLAFVPPRFDVYREISAHIIGIFRRFTPFVQPLSLDEAYLDVTDEAKRVGSATSIAQEIRRIIYFETGLTASAGVSYNRFLAKLASDARKPNGLFVITPLQGPDFVAGLPVEQFHGIGPATARRMATLGIYSGADLRATPIDVLQAHFGKVAQFYFNIARGVDDRPVEPNRARKSLGKETTFMHDLTTWDEVEGALTSVASRVWDAYLEKGVSARTVTLKLKSADFHVITRAASVPGTINDKDLFLDIARKLLAEAWPIEKGVRLLGLTFSSLSTYPSPPGPQLSLF